MGRFTHEAAACDPVRRVVYLTEDEPDGCFYRFKPTVWGDLSAGALDVLCAPVDLVSGPVTWRRVPNPGGGLAGTRNQVPAAKRFDGGEGCFSRDGKVWFTTKGDNRVWVYDGGTGVLAGRPPAVLLLAAGQLRLVVRRRHLRGDRPVPRRVLIAPSGSALPRSDGGPPLPEASPRSVWMSFVAWVALPCSAGGGGLPRGSRQSATHAGQTTSGPLRPARSAEGAKKPSVREQRQQFRQGRHDPQGILLHAGG